MIEGRCHCGAVRWVFSEVPENATVCNCTICRRYGALWAYDYEDERISVSGATRVYVRGEALGFHFCPTCGCVAFWRALRPERDERRRLAVNLRLAQPQDVADVLVHRFDGLARCVNLPEDGRKVADHVF